MLLRPSGLPKDEAEALAQALLIMFGHQCKVHTTDDCGLNWFFLSVRAKAQIVNRMRDFAAGWLARGAA